MQSANGLIQLEVTACHEVMDYFLNVLHLDLVQVDEIWSYIKKDPMAMAVSERIKS